MTVESKSRPQAKSVKPLQVAVTAQGAVKDKTHFCAIEHLLCQAWEVDEAHAFSGESDRLLILAAKIAGDASADEAPQQSQCRAFDIAACINAARLVPGDVESPERTLFIEQAAVLLAEITEVPVDKVLRTDAPRAPAPYNLVKPSREGVEELHFTAFCYMDCARAVLEMYAAEANSAEIFALNDLLCMYHLKAKNAQVSGDVGDLINGILPELSADLEKIEELLSMAIHAEHDSEVLHAVAYLLRDAKAIADGERFVPTGMSQVAQRQREQGVDKP